NIGVLYETGQGVKQNFREAFRWYEMAAKPGLPVAQCNLGQLYATGRGVKADPAKAAEWYLKAARPGDHRFHRRHGGAGGHLRGLHAARRYRRGVHIQPGVFAAHGVDAVQVRGGMHPRQFRPRGRAAGLQAHSGHRLPFEQIEHGGESTGVLRVGPLGAQPGEDFPHPPVQPAGQEGRVRVRPVIQHAWILEQYHFTVTDHGAPVRENLLSLYRFPARRQDPAIDPPRQAQSRHGQRDAEHEHGTVPYWHGATARHGECQAADDQHRPDRPLQKALSG
ncbi:MAG: sel1 repeat family protein, partial [Alcanivorax sp.]|nr:sel1 repeat family protein [Alcanivorax sp.]